MGWRRKGSKIVPYGELPKDAEVATPEEVAHKGTAINITLANASLSLINDIVIFLSADASLISSNRSLDILLGSKVTATGPASTWLGENQADLLKDIQSVSTTGISVLGKKAEFLRVEESSAPLAVSYDIVAVGETAVLNGDTKHNDVVALIVVIRILPELSTSAGLLQLAKSLVQTALAKDAPADSAVRLMNVAAALDDISFAATLASHPIVPGSSPGNSSLVRLLGSTEEAMAGDIDAWDFDVMQFQDRAHLRGLVGHIFTRHFNLTELKIDPLVFASFVSEVQRCYHDNPFHNFFHVVTVTHFLLLLTRATGADEVIAPLLLFATAVSAVVHDVDHPGHNNAFEINAGSEISLLYGEKSVLENHHICVTFRLLRRKETNIFAGLDPADSKKIKKLIVSNIIATDMERHFMLVERVKKIPLSEEPSDAAAPARSRWDFSNEADSGFYCRIMLHAADLSNPVRPYRLSEFWSKCISEEFNNQVKREKSLGMPFMEFMVVDNEKALCKGEIGFASFVVAPMWRAIAVVFPVLHHLEAQLDANVDTWKERMAKLE